MIKQFERQRLIIPASGYFEWLDTERGKIPFYFHLDRELLSLAGIYTTVNRTNSIEHSFAVITTDANDQAAEIHDRMPLLFDNRTDERRWLDPELPITEINDMLQPFNGKLIHYAVSNRMNSGSLDDPSVIEPSSNPLQEERQSTLDDFF